MKDDLIKPNLVKDELTVTLMKALIQNCVELINTLEKKQVKDS